MDLDGALTKTDFLSTSFGTPVVNADTLPLFLALLQDLFITALANPAASFLLFVFEEKFFGIFAKVFRGAEGWRQSREVGWGPSRGIGEISRGIGGFPSTPLRIPDGSTHRRSQR